MSHGGSKDRSLQAIAVAIDEINQLRQGKSVYEKRGNVFFLADPERVKKSLLARRANITTSDRGDDVQANVHRDETHTHSSSTRGEVEQHLKGRRVTLQGLKSVQYNGMKGTVLKYDESRQRFAVRLDEDGKKAFFKLENLTVIGGAASEVREE
ncbi:hypothetical protein GUITHDRAFT_119868 [Guillardia theta CCMP2712]|uniref:Uncharacterized protein n=1 Tax=Guillardia theta (strain CCMP2712) TaxID=905079 RepID=L1ICY1_GUITC|nr:hypothetical protein GUITHDRAFT_119868 [Guillardia theta CCMP2712]EKX33942.1 hypothetical protein GUITHDRAFT_119868 [Guillardia theta CCMP2712]|eukprot:XP_005820922.1 hypothetical protein GUITHDRAFT_119868 [Guillardia theta CCMP2712]